MLCCFCTENKIVFPFCAFVSPLQVNAYCQKLGTISAKSAFREADFMKVVKAIAGEDGVALCRSLLDGIDDDGEGELQSRVTEGRCTVCMGSTYEDDCEEGDDIILCDGCNAEAHIRCLNMKVVPSTEWYCSVCADRQAAREAKAGHGFGLKDVDSNRDRDQEEELVNKALDMRAEEASQGTGAGDTVESTCAYCGMSELDVCSPLVVGQCRREHDAHLELLKQAAEDAAATKGRYTPVVSSVDSDNVQRLRGSCCPTSYCGLTTTPH
jgi:PHD-finger